MDHFENLKFAFFHGYCLAEALVLHPDHKAAKKFVEPVEELMMQPGPEEPVTQARRKAASDIFCETLTEFGCGSTAVFDAESPDCKMTPIASVSVESRRELRKACDYYDRRICQVLSDEEKWGDHLRCLRWILHNAYKIPGITYFD